MQRGILFVLSGPSGVGKGTVLDHLMEDYQDINYSVSATTREPREGEVDGLDYFFIGKEKFNQMKKEDNGESNEKIFSHFSKSYWCSQNQSNKRNDIIVSEF